MKREKIKYIITSSFCILAVLSSCNSIPEKATHEEINPVTPPPISQQTINDASIETVEAFEEYNSYFHYGPVIPGIFQSAVPQGLAYHPEQQLMIISNYMFDGRASCLTTVSMIDSQLKKVVWLNNPGGTPHKEHVGGVTVSNRHIWIASGKGVYNLPLDAFLKHPDNASLEMLEFIPTVVKASFATFSDNILWIGEFVSRDGSYSTPKSHHIKTPSGNINHAWLAGYILDETTDLIKSEKFIDGVIYPDYLISIPDEVQGASFVNGRIILSQSYGRTNNSRISIYRNPFQEEISTDIKISDDVHIPIWVLDDGNREKVITAPPMTEGIVSIQDSVAVLFESGSDKYRSSAYYPQDRIHLLDISTR